MTDNELRHFLFAVVVLLSTAHFTGYLFQRFGMPKVIGEIFGGVLLGKTGLGFLAPEVKTWLFHGFDGSDKLLASLYWMGLILLMFTSGLGIRRDMAKSDGRLLLWLVVGTTSLPFLAGFLATDIVDFSAMAGTKSHPLAFSIVVAIAVAVTSVPVISRIFADLGILDTRFATMVLAAAVFHDVLLWGALAVATGMVGGEAAGPASVLADITRVAVFFIASLTIGPRLLPWLSSRRFNLVRKSSHIGYALLVCLLFAALASLLKVNILFGALLAGVLFGSSGDPEVERIGSRIADFAFAFFVPIYFAMVGFKLDLLAEFNIPFTIGFIVFCTVFQLAATVTSARFAGQSWLPALNLGMAMNARGGPGIVLATVALEYGIINGTFYTTLILLAVITSLAAGSWFRWQLARGRELSLD
jgi:Kef-type K+ transport system membrane component KefB